MSHRRPMDGSDPKLQPAQGAEAALPVDSFVSGARIGGHLTKDTAVALLRAGGVDQWNLSRREGRGRTPKLNAVELRGAELPGIDFESTELMRVRLEGANLRGADFSNAKLQGAVLSSADIAEACFVRANLNGAILVRSAELKKPTNVENADFREASLVGADLRHLVIDAAQLAATDLTSAQLPIQVDFKERLSVVQEAAKNCRVVFLAMLTACAFTFVIVSNTTDAALVSGVGSATLPLLATEIPILGFYYVAPVVVLAVYLYCHVYLQRLWDLLSELPARLPDGRRIDQAAFPWLVVGLVGSYFSLRCAPDKSIPEPAPPRRRQRVRRAQPSKESAQEEVEDEVTEELEADPGDTPYTLSSSTTIVSRTDGATPSLTVIQGVPSVPAAAGRRAFLDDGIPIWLGTALALSPGQHRIQVIEADGRALAHELEVDDNAIRVSIVQ